MSFFDMLVKRRGNWIARQILGLYGIDIPAKVLIGSGFQMPHKGFGTVITGNTIIGDNVTIYHNVTIGRGDIYLPPPARSQARILISDDVIIAANAVVLGGAEDLTIGKGSVVAANAVLLNSTGENEIWGGVPAKLIGKRPV